MKRKISIVVVALLGLFGGCLEVDPLVQGRPTQQMFDLRSERYHGCAYKSDLWESEWANGGDQDHTLHFVRPKYNYWYAWATVLSFGLWMPMDLEWRYNDDDGSVK